MLYRKMPGNGDQLSILGFGCMRLPSKDGKIDRPRAIALLRSAIDQGVNYLDTAWPYHGGDSEVLVGEALRDGYRDRVKLATKLPSWMIQNRADMDRYLDAQLRKLGTDHIDYYLLHALDGKTAEKMQRLGALEFLDTAKKDGRIVNAGFSYHGLPSEFNPIVDAYPWEFCQIQYNYLDENYQAGTAGLRYAAGKGLGVVVMEPLRGGDLARPKPPTQVATIWDEAGARRTPVEWALRWVWNAPEATVVLSGMNDETQLAENLAIAATAQPNALTARELALIRRVGEIYRELLKVNCTACGYCLPCPSEVQIPLCFEEYNVMHLFGPVEMIKFIYALRASGEIGSGKPGFASQCVQCGDCLDKCPQHIPIPDMLAKVVAEMEGPDLMDRVARARKIFKIEA